MRLLIRVVRALAAVAGISDRWQVICLRIGLDQIMPGCARYESLSLQLPCMFLVHVVIHDHQAALFRV